MAQDSGNDRDFSIERFRPYIRLQLFGTKETVQAFIDQLHAIGMIDRIYWGRPTPVPGTEGEWVSILNRRW
ncbi:hypothetical protein [Alkalinema sp. FACHB-956]|uniref:hypothetical protein n=1 Tax=Alkalinema sp. FACHB-956 TaxID=2692768 RepID=UPI0016882EE6|nr:hypothetical protein [Alkalinema sp. FACHB-956]MBD2328774.1 hypothetical protein [Alkalinema sp. FACHB-956]